MTVGVARTAPRVLAVLALGGCLALAGCRQSTSVPLTGTVANDVVTVQAPVVPSPSPDLEAGFGGAGTTAGMSTGSGGGQASAGSRSATPSAAGITGLGSFVRVRSVQVRQGEAVKAGQLIAVLDTDLLDANIRAALAAQKVSQAKVPVIDATLDKIAANRADIRSTRSTVRTTIADLRATRAKLAAQLSTLRATLKRIESLGGGQTPPGGVPTSTPGGVRPPGAPPGGIPSPARLRAGIAQLQAAIARIDAGIAKAESGLGKLSSASAKLSDASVQLRDLRALARIAASASVVGVDLARYQRSLAEVSSPVDGVIVDVVSEGDVIAPGATIAEVRRIGPSRVDGWLAPGDLPAVSIGAKANVGADWTRRVARGRVTRIGARADYPPTSSATKEVHLTRAIPIEITLDPGQPTLPPGTPVDIEILKGSGRR